MATLLRLPVELRLRIYELAISSAPNIINVDEGATSTDPPRSLNARSLAQVDEQLADEMMHLYWSSNTFQAYRLSGMGHYISTDRTYHRWLREIVRHNVRHVRYLQFKGSTASMECIMIVDVDIKRCKIYMRSRKGKLCDCGHAQILRSLMEGILKQIPVVDGQLEPSLVILWTLFDTWFMYNPLRATTLRSWDEFQRQTSISGE